MKNESARSLKTCPICGSQAKCTFKEHWYHHVWRAHLAPYEPGNFRWFKGNMATFGRWRGFWSTIGLISPLFNTLRHWKYRKHQLVCAGLKDLPDFPEPPRQI
jgi:hypothetical protein